MLIYVIVWTCYDISGHLWFEFLYVVFRNSESTNCRTHRPCIVWVHFLTHIKWNATMQRLTHITRRAAGQHPNLKPNTRIRNPTPNRIWNHTKETEKNLIYFSHRNSRDFNKISQGLWRKYTKAHIHKYTNTLSHQSTNL